MKKLEFLVIHCTATPEGREVTKKDIEQWHLKERGWKRVGYSDLIHLDGIITSLIPYDDDEWVDPWEISNGARGFNSVSRHIVYAGGLDREMNPRDTRTDEQWAVMANYVKEFHAMYPDVKIVGHYQLDRRKPFCPGFNVPEWLEFIGIKNSSI